MWYIEASMGSPSVVSWGRNGAFMTRTTIFAAIGTVWTFATTWFLTRYAVPLEVYSGELTILAVCQLTTFAFLGLGGRHGESVLTVTGYASNFILSLVWFLTVAGASGVVPSAGVTFVVAFGAFLGCQLVHQGALLDEELATEEKLKRAAESATEAIRLAARSLTSESGSFRPAFASDSGRFPRL